MYKFCVWNPFLIHKNLINFWVSSMSSTNLYTDIHFTLKVKIFERTRITPTYATWMIFFRFERGNWSFYQASIYLFPIFLVTPIRVIRVCFLWWWKCTQSEDYESCKSYHSNRKLIFYLFIYFHRVSSGYVSLNRWNWGNDDDDETMRCE